MSDALAGHQKATSQMVAEAVADIDKEIMEFARFAARQPDVDGKMVLFQMNEWYIVAAQKLLELSQKATMEIMMAAGGIPGDITIHTKRKLG